MNLSYSYTAVLEVFLDTIACSSQNDLEFKGDLFSLPSEELDDPTIMLMPLA